MSDFDAEKIAKGLYYLRRTGADTQHPVMSVAGVQAMLVYSDAAGAQQAAIALGGADVLFEAEPKILFPGLPEAVTHLLLDYDPESGEGWLLSKEDV